MPLPPNPVVRAGAILRKGGAHEKSASGQRQLRKSQLQDEIEEWLEEANEAETSRNEKGGDTPPSAADTTLLTTFRHLCTV